MATLKQKTWIVTYLLLTLFSVVTFADIDSTNTAPTPAGRVLIIYNDKGYGYEFSKPAMQTFKTALTGDISYMAGVPNFDRDGNVTVPAIFPTPTVDVLDITKVGQGVYSELMATYGDVIAEEKDESGNSLYAEGHELAYWSHVYDLRFRHAFGMNETEATITTDISDPQSDLSLYRQFLEDGGALFVQAEYSSGIYDGYPNRNAGVSFLINLLTNDVFDIENFTTLGTVRPKDFSLEPENFAMDFNDLNAIVANPSDEFVMVMSGGYPKNLVEYGIPLVDASPTVAALLYWAGAGLRTSNGRFFVSFDINGWGDCNLQYGAVEGKITKGTFAVIQNMYDLLSGVKRYSVTKEFVPSRINMGEKGSCQITIHNEDREPLRGFTVVDTLSSCLEYVSDGVLPTGVVLETPQLLPSGETVLTWKIENEIPSGGSVKIELQYEAVSMPPCPN